MAHSCGALICRAPSQRSQRLCVRAAERRPGPRRKNVLARAATASAQPIRKRRSEVPPVAHAPSFGSWLAAL